MWHAYWTRRLTVMRRAGIAVTSRRLRYGIEQVRLPDGATHDVPVQMEKGIDLRLGLDVVRIARNGDLDVAMIFSQDRRGGPGQTRTAVGVTPPDAENRYSATPS